MKWINNIKITKIIIKCIDNSKSNDIINTLTKREKI